MVHKSNLRFCRRQLKILQKNLANKRQPFEQVGASDYILTAAHCCDENGEAQCLKSRALAAAPAQSQFLPALPRDFKRWLGCECEYGPCSDRPVEPGTNRPGRVRRYCPERSHTPGL